MEARGPVLSRTRVCSAVLATAYAPRRLTATMTQRLPPRFAVICGPVTSTLPCVRSSRLATTGWVDAPPRRLITRRTLEIDPADLVPSWTDVPAEFVERGVFLWRDTLESV